MKKTQYYNMTVNTRKQEKLELLKKSCMNQKLHYYSEGTKAGKKSSRDRKQEKNIETYSS